MIINSPETSESSFTSEFSVSVEERRDEDLVDSWVIFTSFCPDSSHWQILSGKEPIFTAPGKTWARRHGCDTVETEKKGKRKTGLHSTSELFEKWLLLEKVLGVNLGKFHKWHNVLDPFLRTFGFLLGCLLLPIPEGFPEACFLDHSLLLRASLHWMWVPLSPSWLSVSSYPSACQRPVLLRDCSSPCWVPVLPWTLRNAM